MKRVCMLAVALLFFAASIVPAGAAEPVKLGFVYIMSGPFATYGQFAKQGAELAIEEINAAGGIDGREVEAYFEDSTGKPDVALRAIRRLVFQEEVDAVVGLDSSGVAKTVVPALSQMKTPLIITHAATPDLTGNVCNPYTFRISLNLPQNVKAGAMLAAATDAKTWGTVGPDYSFGRQSWEYFVKYLSAEKPEAEFLPEGEAAFSAISTTDFNPYITKIMSANPDGVFISLWGGNLIDFIRQAEPLGFFDGRFEVLMSLGAATEVLYALQDKMPEDVWVGTRYWFLANDSEMNKKFRESYQRIYGQFPSYNAHGAYGAVLTYQAAVKKAGSTDKEAVVKALEGLEVELPVGKIKIRPEDHQAITDAVWGKTAADPEYPIRILKPMKKFSGPEITRPVSETDCTME
ncbi:MAG: ABC transporter substrate-binding protein [Desulfococcaceae bacterium]